MTSNGVAGWGVPAAWPLPRRLRAAGAAGAAAAACGGLAAAARRPGAFAPGTGGGAGAGSRARAGSGVPGAGPGGSGLDAGPFCAGKLRVMRVSPSLRRMRRAAGSAAVGWAAAAGAAGCAAGAAGASGAACAAVCAGGGASDGAGVGCGRSLTTAWRGRAGPLLMLACAGRFSPPSGRCASAMGITARGRRGNTALVQQGLVVGGLLIVDLLVETLEVLQLFPDVGFLDAAEGFFAEFHRRQSLGNILHGTHRRHHSRRRRARRAAMPASRAMPASADALTMSTYGAVWSPSSPVGATASRVLRKSKIVSRFPIL